MPIVFTRQPYIQLCVFFTGREITLIFFQRYDFRSSKRGLSGQFQSAFGQNSAAKIGLTKHSA